MAEPMNSWKWFGTAGHFIGGANCRFHLCTQIGKFLVSTVGEYRPISANDEDQEIGCDRKYETMVFRAGEKCSTKDCGCGLPEIDGSEIDFKGYNRRDDATKGHLALCRKYARKR